MQTHLRKKERSRGSGDQPGKSADVHRRDVLSHGLERLDISGNTSQVPGHLSDERHPEGALDHGEEAFATYGVRAGDREVAKLIASKVAIDGAPVPSPAVLGILNPTRADLANALEYGSEFIDDQCAVLIEKGSPCSIGATKHRAMWLPIYETSVEESCKAPAPMLRYMLYQCLLVVDEVHSWAPIGGTPIEPPRATAL